MSVLGGLAKVGKGALHYGDDAARGLANYGDDIARASSKANILAGASKTAKYSLIGGGIWAGGTLAGSGLQSIQKPFQELIYGYEPSEPVKASDGLYLSPFYDESGNVSYYPITTPEAKTSLAKVFPETLGNTGIEDLMLLSMLGSFQASTQKPQSSTNWENILKYGVLGLGLVIVAPPMLSMLTKKKK